MKTIKQEDKPTTHGGQVQARVMCPHCHKRHKIQAEVPPGPEGLQFNTPKERRAFVAYMLAPIQSIGQPDTGPGISTPLSPRRKMYWWFRLKGMDYGKATLAAGYTKTKARAGRDRTQEGKEGQAVGEFWQAGRLNKDFIENNVADIIQSSANASTKVSALNLAAKITQLIRTGLNISIDQRMPVQVLAIAPPARWCHKCGALQAAPTLELPGQDARPGHVVPPVPGPGDVARLGAGVAVVPGPGVPVIEIDPFVKS